MYGPEDHFDEYRSHALGALIMKIVDAKRYNFNEVVVWGTGNPVREWLHVDDAAEAILKSLDINEIQEPINVGIGKGISIRKMAELISDIVGFKGKLNFDTSKADGANYKTLDGSSGERFLNWRPKIEFKEGLRETINWYQNLPSKDL